jgi:hypothetical protein
VAAVVLLGLIAAPPALAQTSSAQDGYSTPAGSVQQQLGGGSDDMHASAVRNTTPSRLPFTGLDIALVLAAGGILLVMGGSVRRLSRLHADD